MPLDALRCLAGHEAEQFVHTPADRGCETRVCPCGHTFTRVFAVGRGLTYFGEGAAGRWIHNLGPDPVYVTSPRQHAAAMRAAGVDWATRWGTAKTGGWV